MYTATTIIYEPYFRICPPNLLSCCCGLLSSFLAASPFTKIPVGTVSSSRGQYRHHITHNNDQTGSASPRLAAGHQSSPARAKQVVALTMRAESKNHVVSEAALSEFDSGLLWKFVEVEVNSGEVWFIHSLCCALNMAVLSRYTPAKLSECTTRPSLCGTRQSSAPSPSSPASTRPCRSRSSGETNFRYLLVQKNFNEIIDKGHL